uniref:Putative secreted protein n=1 Tax=Anopheles triannulatus TaxID=58253 RepID=A0A2M4B5P2_9DIPT
MSLASLSLSFSFFCWVNNGLFAHFLHDLLLLLLHAPVSGALGSSTVIPNCYIQLARYLTTLPSSTTFCVR